MFLGPIGFHSIFLSIISIRDGIKLHELTKWNQVHPFIHPPTLWFLLVLSVLLSQMGIFTLGHFMWFYSNCKCPPGCNTCFSGQSDCLDRPNYCIKQHSGLLSGQPGVCDIIIPLVMQNSYKLLSPGEFAKHAMQRWKIQLRGPENKEHYLYDGTSKTNRALSVEWQIEEDVYYPKML